MGDEVTLSTTSSLAIDRNCFCRWPLVALVAFFLQDLLNGLRILLNNSFEQKVIFDLRSDLFRHIERLPLRWFDNRATGDLITRVVEDVNSVERVLIDGIEQGVVAILQVVIVTVALFYFNGSLVWCVLVPVPLLAAGALAYTLTGPSRYRPQRRAASALNALLLDDLAGIRQIKSFVREKQEHDRFNRASETLRQATLRIMRAWALYSPSMDFVNSLGLVLAIGFGGRAVLRGEMQIGSLVAFITLTRFLYEPVTRLHQLNQLVQAGRAAGERVFEILDEPEEPGLEPRRNDHGDRRRDSFRRRQFRLRERSAGAEQHFVSRPARTKRLRWSERPAPANRPWSICSPVSTNTPPAPSRSTGNRFAILRCTLCAK